MGSERQAFVVPAGLLVEQTSQGLALTFPGDVVLEAALSFPVARIRSESGDVVLAADMEVAQIEAPAGVVRARSGLRSQRIVAREVQVSGSLHAGSVYAERIRVDGDCHSDRLMAERGGIQLGGNTRIKEELVANGGDIVVAGTLHAGRVLCPQGRVLLRNDVEVSSIQAGRSLTLQGRTKAEDLRAGDAVEAYEILEARSIRADAVRLTGPRTELRLVQARSVISVGPGKITADVFIAPVVDLSSRASGRVTVVECHNTLGPSAVTGKLRLTELASLIGDVDQFLADRGLDRLPDGTREVFAPEPELSDNQGPDEHLTVAVKPAPTEVSETPAAEPPTDAAPPLAAAPQGVVSLPPAPPTPDTVEPLPSLPLPEERISESLSPVARRPAAAAEAASLAGITTPKPDLAAVLAAALADLEAEGFGPTELDVASDLTEAELEESEIGHRVTEAGPPAPTAAGATDIASTPEMAPISEPIGEESPEKMSESESEWLSSAGDWNFDDPEAESAEGGDFSSASTTTDPETGPLPGTPAPATDAPVAHDTHEYAASPGQNAWEADQSEWAQQFSDPPTGLPEEGQTENAEEGQHWPEEGDSKAESLDWWGDEGDLNLDELEFDSLEAREPAGAPAEPPAPLANTEAAAYASNTASGRTFPASQEPMVPEDSADEAVSPAADNGPAEDSPADDGANPAELDWWDDAGLSPDADAPSNANTAEEPAQSEAKNQTEESDPTANVPTAQDPEAEERQLRAMIGELGEGPPIAPAAPVFQRTDLITDRALEAPSAQIKPLGRESRIPIETEGTTEDRAGGADAAPESQEELVFDASDVPDEPEDGSAGASEEATARAGQAEPTTDELVAMQLASPPGKLQGHPMPELESEPDPAAAIFDMSREGTENVEVIPVRPPSGPQPAGQGQLMLLDEAAAQSPAATPEPSAPASAPPTPPPLVMPKPTLQALEPVPLSWSQGALAPTEGEPASATLIAQTNPAAEARSQGPEPTLPPAADKPQGPRPSLPVAETRPQSPTLTSNVAEKAPEPSPVPVAGAPTPTSNRRVAPPLPLPGEHTATAPAAARGPTVPYKAPAEGPPDPVYSLMLETMGRIRNSYDGRTLPPPIEEINTLLASRDYPLIRESFPTLVTALVEHHRGRSEQLNPKVSHQLRIIDTLVRNL